MDPFVFDQKFARFVAQVDSGAMREGTELYENGAAVCRVVRPLRFEGNVTEGRRGLYSVSLVVNKEGGFSGSCQCDQFFNCKHAYALARVVRDRIVGAAVGEDRSEMVVKKDPVKTGLAARLSSDAGPRERRVCDQVERLWKTAQKSGYLIYPRDVRSFVKTPQVTSEPFRDLKEGLADGVVDSAEEFADALAAYFEYRQFEVDAGFCEVARSEESRVTFSGKASGAQKKVKLEDKPLKLEYAFRLEETTDRDWFQVSARPVVAGGYSDEDIRLLQLGKGQLVNLPGKGWRRLDMNFDGPTRDALREIGVDPERGNSQRLHVSQVEELVPEGARDGEEWKDAGLRAEQLKATPAADVPQCLKGVLRPYQEEGFQYLCGLSYKGGGGILADDMGLGKTLQTLAWLLWLKENRSKGSGFRVLVVCPKSVADNWIREPSDFDTGLISVLYRSKKSVGVELENADIVVTNYSQLRIGSEYFLSSEWDAVILDEGQYIKSPRSQTTKVAYQVKTGHRLILSGTPIENRLTDLWSLMRFAMPGLLGPQVSFALNYNVKNDPKALAALKRRIRPFLLRRLKSQVAKDLPERIEKDIHCELEGRQRKMYDDALTEARASLSNVGSNGSSGKERFNVLQALLRLRQICCDARLVLEDKEQEIASAKLEALMDIVEPLVEEGHKVLVFSQFVSVLSIIEKAFSKSKIPNLSLTGKTQNRKELVDRFQSDDGEPVFLLSLKAAGSGLNLTAASYVVLFDPWWNPAVEAQAIDRAHRIGQTNTVIAYRLLAKNTIEEKIRLIQTEKSDLAGAVIDDELAGDTLSLDHMRELLGE